MQELPAERRTKVIHLTKNTIGREYTEERGKSGFPSDETLDLWDT